MAESEKKGQKIRKFRVTRGSYCFGNYSPGMERDPLPDMPPHTATFSIAEFLFLTPRASPLRYLTSLFTFSSSFPLTFAFFCSSQLPGLNEVLCCEFLVSMFFLGISSSVPLSTSPLSPNLRTCVKMCVCVKEEIRVNT